MLLTGDPLFHLFMNWLLHRTVTNLLYVFKAGDHVKFGFPMAWTTTALAWGMLLFEQGYRAAGQYDMALDAIRWPLDYFIKCHVSDDEFFGQVRQ